MKRVNQAILTAYLDGELTQAERQWIESKLAESADLQATLTQLRWEKSLVDQGLDILAPPLRQTLISSRQKQAFSKNGTASSALIAWEAPGLWSAAVNAIGKTLGDWRFYLYTASAIGLIIIGASIFRVWFESSSEIDRAGMPPIIAPATTAKPILFTTYADETGGARIYTFRLYDLALTPLPNLDTDAEFASLSMIGEQVIVSTTEAGDIVVMDGPDHVPINLTNSPDIVEKYPALSPDGRRIAFTDGKNISLIYLGGGKQKIIAAGISGTDLVWSPEGQRLAFLSAKGGQTDLYVINIDGTNLINLTKDAILEMHPTWSPDGQRIAFADGDSLTIIDLAGTNRVKLPYDNPRYHAPRQPLWSPDGTRLAFVASRMALSLDAQIQTLFTIKVDGSHLTPLTDEQTWVGAFDWSPDGRHLVFARGEYGQEQLYVMNADGTGQIQLTDDRIKGIGYIEWGVR